MAAEMVNGLLLIGDPHLSSRVPGFRRDDYPRAILGKLRQALALAAERRLVPVILGDIFHVPRDNANWLLTEMLVLLAGRGVVAIHGNHDCSETSRLVPDDSLAVLEAAGVLALLDGPTSVRRYATPGGTLVLGGTPWGAPLPAGFDRQPGDAHVVWITHHDLAFADAFGGHLPVASLPGIDRVVNGHLHAPVDAVRAGATEWLNPGNIARVKRGDMERSRVPAVTIIEAAAPGVFPVRTEVLTHQPYDEVFHPKLEEPAAPVRESMFIRGLAELTNFRTADGSGLMEFLDKNLDKSDITPAVAEAIRALAKEVCSEQQQS